MSVTSTPVVHPHVLVGDESHAFLSEFVDDVPVKRTEPVVVIPTFNEAKNLNRLLPLLLELPVKILIVDDASTDGSAEIVREVGAKTGRVQLLERPGKFGLGSAYRDGFALAQSQGCDLIIQMDADGSHRVEDLYKMLDYLEVHSEVELVIGSRWTKGGSVQNWPKRREILSRLANLYSRLALGLKVKDNTAGFRIYRVELLNRMDLSRVSSEGYAFQIEMTREAVRVGANIAEVPILFVEREFGISKMSSRIIREALVKVTKWGISRLLGR